MNKLRNEIMLMKIQLNSSYGMGSVVGTSLYDEMLKKKNRFFKIQKRVLKIKSIYG
jgi:hypothetical protein